MVNFHTRIAGCDSHSPALFDFFTSSDANIFVLQWLSLHWEILIMSLSHQFHWLPIIFTTGSQVSSHNLWLFLCWLGQSSWSFNRCSMRISLTSVLLLLPVNFVSRISLELMQLYILHRKYQVKPHSSPWFSPACATAIVYRNYLFYL